ncbi:MAG: DinB family protein [Saprospiraceae bacterium]
MQKFRTQGAIGALLDEYEKSISELQALLRTMTPLELTTLVAPKSKDPDCVSIQSILSHVVRAGYGYTVAVRISLGETLEYPSTQHFDSPEAYQKALMAMFAYQEKLFADYPNLSIEEYNPAKKIHTRWGQRYDVEQLFEHAIVHILRHRRQVEKFLLHLR